MRAVIYDPAGPRVDDIPEPTLSQPDDAIVDVTHAAVCGTDLHLLVHPEGLRSGTVLGHEFVGRIREIGPRVAGLAPGDLVVGADYTACGTCWWCRNGRHWHCAERQFFGTGTAFGPELMGAQADCVRVPFAQTCLRRLPVGIPPAHALLLGDTLATAYAATSALSIAAGAVVAIVGGGPVGQLAALCAQVRGAGHVIVVEPVGDRRVIAQEQGSVAVAPEDAREVVLDLTDGRGADGVVDAVGAPTGFDLALDLARAAGTVVSVGVPTTEHHRLDVRDAFQREIAFGFVIGNFMRDAEVLMDILVTKLVDAVPLLDPGFALDQPQDAYNAMRERRTLKAVMTA